MKNYIDNFEAILDAMTETTLLNKGFDIETEEGLIKAAEFLKNATWEDAFISDVPSNYYQNVDQCESEFDEIMGTWRLGLLQENVMSRLGRSRRS